ncbi:MAG: hypothetical protein FJX67_18375, partial [Alphaproteobacteria bacterium]|nr:hypothetical protein [Alphaproteobacteria bacterium]
MTRSRMLLVLALPLALAAGCTTLSAEDRALLDRAARLAQEAKNDASQASATANRAAASADAAAQAAR